MTVCYNNAKEFFMTSYLKYKQHMAVLDADDDNVESWITVRGNHIPIKKGQSKEDAVKAFIEKKGGNTAKGSNQKSELSVIYHKDKGHIKEGRPPKDWSKVEGALTAPNGYSWYSNNKSMFGGERESYLYKDEPSENKSSTPKNTYLSNENTLKEFASHFGIRESAAKSASEKYGDAFYKVMIKDRNAGQSLAINQKDYELSDVEKWLENAKENVGRKGFPMKQASAPDVKYVDKKAWNSPASDPFKSYFD